MFRGDQNLLRRKLLAIVAVAVLVIVYLFQNFDLHGVIISDSFILHPFEKFIVNKFVRLTFNDSACLLLIYTLFYEQKYLKIGTLVQLFEMFIILPIYFIIKLTVEGDSEISSPLLSQIHRLIVNPILMILLIFSLYLPFREIRNTN